MYEQLKKIFGDRIKEGEPLARYTTFKIGGPADCFFDAKTKEECIQAVTLAKKHHIPFFILGGGTNILIGDKGIRAFVIKNSSQGIFIKGMKGSMGKARSIGTVFVEVDSGVAMNKLVRFTIEEGLGGLEMQLGLPGTVGGAVYMNSKWTHPEGYVGDSVFQATILTPSGDIRTVSHDYFRFAYDFSILQQSHDILISVTFALSQRNKEELWNIANDSIAYRRTTQPQGILSAGCTFRNISKAEALTASTPNHTTSAGYLVDSAGLKGAKIGDAQISPIHANFIVNLGHAKAREVVELIEKARSAVSQKFGVTLVEEIVRVGEF